MNKDVMFSSACSEWETPDWLFNWANAQFSLNKDVCATVNNTKCEVFINQKDTNALEVPWVSFFKHRRCWMNPPYGRAISSWVAKAYFECQVNLNCDIVVCLLPARTDTKWWWDYCLRAFQIIFFKGRVKFVGAESGAPFPSAIVVFKRGTIESPKIIPYIEWKDLREIRKEFDRTA